MSTIAEPLSRRWTLFACGIFLFCLTLISCSLSPSIPVVSDRGLEELINTEAARIITATPDAGYFSRYQIFLSDFPRQDILGMSIGHRRIYISYELARLASNRSRNLWLLRQTLAHEIAHEIAGHATHTKVFNNPSAGLGITSRDIGLPWTVRFHNYSQDNELQADLEGMKYWAKLHWDCRIWVRILEDFKRQNYSGGPSHPTDKRLEQASRVCLTQSSEMPLAASLTTPVR